MIVLTVDYYVKDNCKWECNTDWGWMVLIRLWVGFAPRHPQREWSSVHCILYSTNYLKDWIFTDWPLANFCRNESHRLKIPVSHAYFWWSHAQFVFAVAATHAQKLASKFKCFWLEVNFFKGLLDFVHWSLSQLLHVEPSKSILHLRCLLTDIHNGHRRNLQKLEEFATIESHVTLGIHAIVQKWNSYHFYSFEEVNFCSTGWICENRTSYAPRKFGTKR